MQIIYYTWPKINIMKITFTNEHRLQLTLNKYEYAVICATDNRDLPPEYWYDLNEILRDEHEEITITEDDLDENENGFVMWSDTFWDTITEFTGYGEPREMEIPVTFDIYTDFLHTNGLQFFFKRHKSDDLCPSTYTPWEVWLSDVDGGRRIDAVFDNIDRAKKWCEEHSQEERFDYARI